MTSIPDAFDALHALADTLTAREVTATFDTGHGEIRLVVDAGRDRHIAVHGRRMPVTDDGQRPAFAIARRP